MKESDFTDRALKCLKMAATIAAKRSHKYVGVEDLVRGIFKTAPYQLKLELEEELNYGREATG